MDNNRTRRIDMLQGPIIPILVKIMGVMLVSAMFQQLCAIGEAFLAGRFAPAATLPIIGGSCNTLIGLFNSLAGGLVTGSMMTIAISWGRGDQRQSEAGVNAALALAAVLGLSAAAAYVLAARPLLGVLQVPAALIDGSARYLRLYALGFIPSAIFQTIIGAQRASGLSHQPTRLLIGSYVVNIILDAILVGAARLAQTGIALAFVITQSVCCLVGLRVLYGTRFWNQLRRPVDRTMIRDILAIAVPAAAASAVYSLTNMLVQSSINRLGTLTITAFALHARIENVYWIIMSSIGLAVTSFVGQNHGAGQPGRVWAAARSGILLSWGITVLTSMVFAWAGPYLTRVLTADAAAAGRGASILAYMAPFYFLYPPIEVLGPVLRCQGRSLSVTVITIICICGVRTAWILGYALGHLSFQSVLAAFPLSWLAASAVFGAYAVALRRHGRSH